MLLRDKQKEVMSASDGNSKNCCRRVVSGSYNQGHKIEFDELTIGFKTVHVKKKGMELLLLRMAKTLSEEMYVIEI